MDKLILVTRKTRLEALTERFNTQAQAKFYLTQAGLDFADYAHARLGALPAQEPARRHSEGEGEGGRAGYREDRGCVEAGTAGGRRRGGRRSELESDSSGDRRPSR